MAEVMTWQRGSLNLGLCDAQGHQSVPLCDARVSGVAEDSSPVSLRLASGQTRKHSLHAGGAGAFDLSGQFVVFLSDLEKKI